MRFQQGRRSGLAIVELIFAGKMVVIFLAFVSLCLGRQVDCQRNDSKYAQQIHYAFVLYGENNDGRMPTPGLINCLADSVTGMQLPGRGPEDITRNHTAPMCSVLIMQNYLSPEAFVSPCDVSRLVQVKQDYNYDIYNPIDDHYWDDSFAADVEHGVSNVSYAHMPIAGEKKRQELALTMCPDILHAGNRGPYEGAMEGTRHDAHLTCRFHEPKDQWSGHLVFGDNHVEFRTRDELLDESRRNAYGVLDLPFTDDGTGVDDQWLGIYTSITEDEEMTFVWDPID